MDIAQVVSQMLLLCGVSLAGALLGPLLRLPFALCCVLLGFAYGQSLPALGLDTGVRAANFADLIFFVLLPLLIFEAGWHIDSARLRRWLVQILVLAIPGLLVSTLVGAILLYFGFAHPAGFPLIAALLTACLLAATDPVTVIQQLRGADAPPDLVVVIEGESLFNDATAIVLFAALISYALALEGSAEVSVLHTLLSFAIKFFGGLACGVVAGLITAGLLILCRDRASFNLTLVLSAFASFCASETLLHVSGIVAVLACALTAKALVSPDREQQHSSNETLAWLGLLCNALLFTLMGLAFEPAMVEHRWLAMLIGILAALVARTVTIYGCISATRCIGSVSVPTHFAPLMVWGGLRGAVTIALALSLPTELPYWWTIQAIAFGVVVFNLFVQGPTSGWLLRRLLTQDRGD